MNGLIRASLKNPYAVTVGMLTIVILGVLSVLQIPFDILPVFRSPAVQVLTFYGGCRPTASRRTSRPGWSGGPARPTG